MVEVGGKPLARMRGITIELSIVEATYLKLSSD